MSERELGSFPPPPEGRLPLPPARAPGDLYARPPDLPPSFDARKNLGLFVLTVASVFFVGRMYTATERMTEVQAWLSAWTFAVPFLGILLCHEFGHYIAARLHGVPASLPYFIPLPIFSPFGTLGAVILMPERIRSRRALLDIGAAGPLAGMVVAIPVMIVGLHYSPIIETGGSNYQQEGQSLLYWALKRLVVGPIPAGHDISTHPTALAAWAGFFITYLNLLPFAQLDGGHVAFALFGERQNRVARWLFWFPVVVALYNALHFGVPALREALAVGVGHTREGHWRAPVSATLNSLGPILLLLLVRRAGGLGHPPVDDHELEGARWAIGLVTLALFVLLFMPSPWVTY